MIKTIQNLPSPIRRFCWLAAGYQFFASFVLFFMVYTLVLADLGFNAIKITSLLSLFFIVKILAEVPSSILADRFSRRLILIYGECFSLASLVFLYFLPHYWAALLGMMCSATYKAFVSGTLNAYIYDELKFYNQESKFLEVSTFISTALFAALFLANFGSYIYINFGYKAVITATLFFKLIAFIILLKLPEIGKTSANTTKNISAIVKTSYTTFKQNPNLFWLYFLISGLVVGGYFLEYRSKVLSDLNFSKHYLTYLMFVHGAATLLGTYFAARFKLNLWCVVAVCTLMFVSLFLLPTHNATYFSVMCLAIFFYVVYTNLLNAKNQDLIPSEVRASVMSGGSMFGSVIYIVGNFIIGYVAQQTNNFAIACSAAMIIPLIFFTIYGVFGGKHRI